jgi:hypothetical protein
MCSFALKFYCTIRCNLILIDLILFGNYFVLLKYFIVIVHVVMYFCKLTFYCTLCIRVYLISLFIFIS